MDRHDDASRADYEQLRRHLKGPRREPAAGGKQPRAAIVQPPPAPAATRLSVMEWLFAVGHVVGRKLRRAPRSPMVRLHPKR
jgi:hypothetical protein